ncbi:MAG TPA: alpha/beta hydrolase [Candidatus Stackebrandtia excrementipullorum]|nr:alpha/beta hydrolase [Candidatus Stackebrandtia excrementipullorum]
MRSRKRFLAGVAAGAVAVGASFVMTPQAQAENATVDWQPCEGAEEVQCASIEVPLDWANPDGRTIEIALAKREASNPDARLGSIVMDPGGPGGSGVETVKAVQMLPEATAERFDIVGFDPRGVMNSTEVLCGEDVLTEYFEQRQPESRKDWFSLSVVNKALYIDCKVRSGDLIDHAHNLQTVEDIEAIRQALGEGKLNYLGYSYGSLMGQQYAEAYPENIRTMVLDGNMDHSITEPWEFARSEVAPIEETFNQFADWCETTEDCALYGQDVRAYYADLKDRARDGDLIDPATGDPIDFYDLSSLAFATGQPEVWGMVADNMVALNEGEGTMRALAGPEEVEEMNGLYSAAWCGDYGFDFDGYGDWEDIRERLSEEFPNVEWTQYADHTIACVGSPIKNKNPQRELDIDEDTSIVMIGNRYDPATVYEWNLAAAEQSGARLVTYEGYGHTAYRADGPSSCVNDAVSEYFINQVEPEEGLSCEATEQPGVMGTMNAGPDVVGPYATR